MLPSQKTWLDLGFRSGKMWSESDRKGRLRFWWLEGVAYVKGYVVCVFLGGGHEFEII